MAGGPRACTSQGMPHDLNSSPEARLRAASYVRALHRASRKLGGVRELAMHLRVTDAQADRWLDGVEVPPIDAYRRAIAVFGVLPGVP